MSADLLRQQALAMIANMQKPTGPRPKMDEAAVMIAALVAVLDAYTPLIHTVNEAGEVALQNCIKIVEAMETWDYTGMDMEPVPGAEFLSRSQVLEKLLEMGGYVRASELAAAGESGELH